MALNHSIAALVAALSIASTSAVAQTASEPDASNQASATSSAKSDNAPTPAGSALLSHLVTGSFDIGAPANVAGVLQFCQRQDAAGQEAVATADALVEAQGGLDVLRQEPAFARGERGILVSAQDRRFTLAGTDDDMAGRLCKRIADKAKAAFLSGT